jgi:hypothetical protein
MPDATITSTASTFGTISGVFSADQSTISGTISGIVPGTLTGSVGVPGPAGPAGIGLPAGGTSGQFLQKTSGVDYATDWVTVNLTGLATESWVTAGFYPLTGNPSGFLTASSLTPYLTKADNLASVASFSAARDNLGLGLLNSPTFAGVTVQGSGANVANLTPTSLSLTHVSSGSFTIQPSVGITFPDASVQTTAFTGIPSAYISSVSSPLSVTSGNLSVDLSAYLTSATAASTYQTLAGMSSYLTTSAAAAGYYPLTGNPSAFLTAASLSGYATESWVTAGFASLARGLPAGGEDGQIIVKDGTVDYATIWTDNSAETLTVRATNKTGSTLNKGSVVRITGAQGQRPTIALAQGNSGASADGVIGILLATLANNASGLVCTAGLAKRLDTSAYTEGVKLFLSPSVAGGLTPTRPSAPDHAVAVGIVSHSSATTGSIEVNVVVGDHLEWLHDVLITTPTNGQVLKYDSTTSLWKNQTDAVGAVTSVAGRTGAVVLANTDISGLGTMATATAADYQTTAVAASTYATILEPSVDGILTVEPSGSNSANVNVNQDANNYIHLRAGAGQIAMIVGGSTRWFFNDTYLQFPGGTQQTVAYPGPSGFLLKADNLSGLANTSTARTNLGLGTMATATASDYSTTTAANGLYYPLSSNPSSYLVAADIAGKAPLASPALTGNVTITSNSTGAALFIEQAGTGNILTLHDQASDTTFVAIDQNGKVNTIPAVTASAGFNVPHGAAPTTPVNGDIWTTTSGLFMRQNGVTRQYVDLDGTQTINGTKTFSASTQTLGSGTATGTINVGSGATISGSTKTVNIGTAGVAGSTTNIAIGSTTGTSTTTLQGITNGVTAAVDTNSVALATTAYVVGQAGSATPLVNGTAAVGTSLRYARQDHVHGTDTTRAPLASPALTGTPTAPTATLGTNTTQIATTAFVLANASSGAAWGSITGTLSSQTDLQSALDAKLSTATAATTYYPLTGNPSGFLTSAPVTSVAGRTGAITLANTDISGLGTMSTATAADYSTTTVANGLYYPLSSNPAGYLTSSSLTGYATESFVTSQGYITSSALTPYAPLAGATFTGKVTTVASATGGAGLNLPHGAAPTTPVNGDIWTTTGNIQWRRNGGTQSLPNIGTSNTFSAGAKQTVSHSATTAGLNVGPVAGDPSTPANGDVWLNSTTNALNARVNGGTHQLNTVKAWVNFNGTGTPAIRGSLNVSSITDNGVGDYTVNLTTAIADTNYCVVANCSYTANGARGSIWAESYATSTTSTRIITSANSSPFVFDCVSVTVAILR